MTWTEKLVASVRAYKRLTRAGFQARMMTLTMREKKTMKRFLSVCVVAALVLCLGSVSRAQLLPDLEISSQLINTNDLLSYHLPETTVELTSNLSNIEQELSTDLVNLNADQVGRLVYHERLTTNLVDTHGVFTASLVNIEMDMSVDLAPPAAKEMSSSLVNIHEEISSQFPTPHDD